LQLPCAFGKYCLFPFLCISFSLSTRLFSLSQNIMSLSSIYRGQNTSILPIHEQVLQFIEQVLSYAQPIDSIYNIYSVHGNLIDLILGMMTLTSTFVCYLLRNVVKLCMLGKPCGGQDY
jgi:hypothetical protein